MNSLPIGVRRVVSWLIIGTAWTVLLALGVCCALALPLNLLLVPCWLAAASSVGTLARNLLDVPTPAASPSPTAAEPRRHSIPVPLQA